LPHFSSVAVWFWTIWDSVQFICNDFTSLKRYMLLVLLDWKCWSALNHQIFVAQAQNAVAVCERWNCNFIFPHNLNNILISAATATQAVQNYKMVLVDIFSISHIKVYFVVVCRWFLISGKCEINNLCNDRFPELLAVWAGYGNCIFGRNRLHSVISFIYATCVLHILDTKRLKKSRKY
jgi:hypothetical protein